MSTRLRWTAIRPVVLSAALCVGAVAFAQTNAGGGTAPAANANAPNKAAGGSADEYPDLVEIDPFGGV
ncbi:MAG: hypothetical protein JO061_11870, partial [Acidobacteriaceae bacterium]|nr:hypothetical protein [Acidobacteriaceae bacterium]